MIWGGRYVAVKGKTPHIRKLPQTASGGICYPCAMVRVAGLRVRKWLNEPYTKEETGKGGQWPGDQGQNCKG